MCFAVDCRVVACSTMFLFDMYYITIMLVNYLLDTMHKQFRLGRHYKNEDRKKVRSVQ